MNKLFLSFFICLSLYQGPAANGQAKTSALVTYPHFTKDTLTSPVAEQAGKSWHQTKVIQVLATPSLLIGYGLYAFGDNGFPYSSKEAFTDRNKFLLNFHTHIDDITWAVPAAAVYGLGLFGIKGKHKPAYQTLFYMLSTALTNGAVLGLKEVTNRIRPDSTSNLSFPSGHTANAFMSAEFLHQEYSHRSAWYSVAGYTVAAATGTMRVLNNRHWLTDVFVGAGIGMLSTKLVYAMYPLIDETFWKGKNKTLAIIPTYQQNTAGVTMILLLH